MIINGVASEYEFPKFNPMTCTIAELTIHWKDYTNSEPIWNEVRNEIYQHGKKDNANEFIDYLREQIKEMPTGEKRDGYRMAILDLVELKEQNK